MTHRPGLLYATDHAEHRLLEVLDKGKAASVTTIVQTRNKDTGQLLFENQVTVFIRGAGGFGGKRTGAGMSHFFRPNSVKPVLTSRNSNVTVDRGAATAANVPPKRAPDAVMEEKTSPTQAALYRLVLFLFMTPSWAMSHRGSMNRVKQSERRLQSITRMHYVSSSFSEPGSESTTFYLFI